MKRSQDLKIEIAELSLKIQKRQDQVKILGSGLKTWEQDKPIFLNKLYQLIQKEQISMFKDELNKLEGGKHD